MKNFIALLIIAVVIFGGAYLLTSDWPFGGPAEEAPTAGEAALPAPENPE